MVWDAVRGHRAEVPVIQMRDIGSTHSYIAGTVSENLDVPLEVQGVIFLADLMELPFEEFDLILGMDWAEKLVRKGCEAYLAYISVSHFRDTSVKDIKTVKEFQDVFPEELPGLPQNREVEFEIELLPSIAPVSITHYRMELK
ncbi:uncharacterized protein [Gossypium hirsutum]|uniref:RVP_2 domain-containing protein n=1 Tax=Gossypium hirsutum TaxID=3635 RepID=A0A1U8KUE7_GOSHI|nr:uncharacterized protein LOC107919378 [Gossypium hirsutum]